MSVLIVNAKIFDGKDTLDGLYDIAIRDEKIMSIVPHSELLEPKRNKSDCGMIVDAGGAWVMPGLIDLHVHLTWNGGPDPAADIVNSEFPEHLIETVSNALKYLPHGITSVRDLGSPEDACLYVYRRGVRKAGWGRSKRYGASPGKNLQVLRNPMLIIARGRLTTDNRR